MIHNKGKGLYGKRCEKTCHCEEVRRGNRTLYRAAVLPCGCHATFNDILERAKISPQQFV